MEPLLPQTLALFDAQRREQQHFVRTAEIQRTLRETQSTALRVLDRLADRGIELDRQAEQAEQVLASSAALAYDAETLRRSRSWWRWCCCCRGGRPLAPAAAATAATTSRAAAPRRTFRLTMVEENENE